MIDSMYYIVDVFSLMFLFHWAIKKDDESE